jgi:hypothetical protein
MYGQCVPSRKRMVHTSRPQNNTVVIPGTNNMMISDPINRSCQMVVFPTESYNLSSSFHGFNSTNGSMKLFLYIDLIYCLLDFMLFM